MQYLCLNMILFSILISDLSPAELKDYTGESVILELKDGTVQLGIVRVVGEKSIVFESENGDIRKIDLTEILSIDRQVYREEGEFTLKEPSKPSPEKASDKKTTEEKFKPEIRKGSQKKSEKPLQKEMKDFKMQFEKADRNINAVWITAFITLGLTSTFTIILPGIDLDDGLFVSAISSPFFLVPASILIPIFSVKGYPKIRNLLNSEMARHPALAGYMKEKKKEFIQSYQKYRKNAKWFGISAAISAVAGLTYLMVDNTINNFPYSSLHVAIPLGVASVFLGGFSLSYLVRARKHKRLIDGFPSSKNRDLSLNVYPIFTGDGGGMGLSMRF